MNAPSDPPEFALSPFGAAAVSLSSRTRNFQALAELLSIAAARGANPMLARSATAAVARALDADRAGVWLYDQSRARCHGADLFVRSSERHEVPSAMSSDEVRALFARRDAHALAVPIATRRGAVGMLRVERAGRGRGLSDEEQCFVRAVADVIALCVEPAMRARSPRVSSLPPPA